MKHFITLLCMLFASPVLANNTNPWPIYPNYFNNPASARALLGAAAIDGSSPFSGSGATVTSSAADRATFNGKSFDLRLDLGAPCTGSSQAADTAAFQSYKTIANASSIPTRLMIPIGTCVLTPQEYLFTKSLSIEGYSEYGSVLQIAAGSDISGVNMIHENGGTSFVTRNMTYDVNHATALTGKSEWLLINPNNDIVIDHIRIINGGTVGALPAQMQLITATGFNSFIATNNFFSFDATQNTANGAMNLGSIQFPANNATASNNISVNTELFQHIGVNHVTVANNIITGVGYGAGIGNSPYFSDQAAAASWNVSDTTITMNAAVPSYILNGSSVYDRTSSLAVGTLLSHSGSTITLVSGAAIASTGSTDNLRFSIQTDFDVTYSGNVISDTGTVPDVNNTYVQGIENWVTGAVIFGNKIRNTCGNSIANAARADVEDNLMEDPGSCTGTPNDAFFHSAIGSNQSFASGVTSSAAGSTYRNNTARNVNTTNGTYGLSDTATAGVINIGVNNFGLMPSGSYNITGSATFLQPTVLVRSQIPFVLTSSGTMGNNGALSAITAMNTTYPSAYYWMEAGQIASGSAAGWYYGIASSTTAVTLYNNTYTSGTPVIPASPTAFVTTGAGTLTRTVATQFPSITTTLPANLMGLNGTVEVKGSISYNNSAGAKSLIGALGSGPACAFSQLSPSTTVQSGFFGGFSTSGVATVERSLSNSAFFQPSSNASAMTYCAKDMTASQITDLTLKVAVATDTITLESVIFTFIPGL